MRLATLFTILVVVAFAGIMLYFLIPILMQSTYQEELNFNLTGDASFEGHSYYTGNSTVGSYKLNSGDTVLVEEMGSPCGSSCLQFHYAFLINQETGNIEDAAKLLIVNPSQLEPPQEGNYTVGIGVIKSRLYDQNKSEGTWQLEITIKRE